MDIVQLAIWVFFISGLLMTGIIWLIQLVHYPMFHRLEKTDYAEHMKFHGQTISYLVAPIMVVELISGFIMQVRGDDYDYSWEFRILLLVLVLIIWMSTFYVQIPAHQKLKRGYNKSIVNKLIRTNWLRTGLWTLKSIILSFYLV